MGGRINLALHILSLVSFIVAVAVNFAALFGPAWWVNKGTVTEIGLLRFCVPATPCDFRKYLFQFEKKIDNLIDLDLLPDVILTCLIVSTALCIMGILVSLLLFMCRRHRTPWCCGSSSAGMFAMIGAIVQFGGLGYGQYYNKNNNGLELGWSAIVAWVGATALFFGMIFSFMLVCVRPKGQNGGVVNVRSNSNYSAYMKTKSSGYGHKNNAYKDDFMMS